MKNKLISYIFLIVLISSSFSIKIKSNLDQIKPIQDVFLYNGFNFQNMGNDIWIFAFEVKDENGIVFSKIDGEIYYSTLNTTPEQIPVINEVINQSQSPISFSGTFNSSYGFSLSPAEKGWVFSIVYKIENNQKISINGIFYPKDNISIELFNGEETSPGSGIFSYSYLISKITNENLPIEYNGITYSVLDNGLWGFKVNILNDDNQTISETTLNGDFKYNTNISPKDIPVFNTLTGPIKRKDSFYSQYNIEYFPSEDATVSGFMFEYQSADGSIQKIYGRIGMKSINIAFTKTENTYSYEIILFTKPIIIPKPPSKEYVNNNITFYNDGISLWFFSIPIKGINGETFTLKGDILYDISVLPEQIPIFGQLIGPISSNGKFAYDLKVRVFNNDGGFTIGYSIDYFINPENKEEGFLTISGAIYDKPTITLTPIENYEVEYNIEFSQKQIQPIINNGVIFTNDNYGKWFFAFSVEDENNNQIVILKGEFKYRVDTTPDKIPLFGSLSSPLKPKGEFNYNNLIQYDSQNGGFSIEYVDETGELKVFYGYFYLDQIKLEITKGDGEIYAYIIEKLRIIESTEIPEKNSNNVEC